MPVTSKKKTGNLMDSKKKGRAGFMDGHIGGRLRQRRSLLGITQEKLAESVGITFQQIQKYENGVNRISAGRLFEFSEILDVPVSFFFENFAGGKKKSSYASGLAEGNQASFEGEEDILKRKETLQLIRVYYSIRNPKLRKDLFNLVKSMADNMRDQDGES